MSPYRKSAKPAETPMPRMLRWKLRVRRLRYSMFVGAASASAQVAMYAISPAPWWKAHIAGFCMYFAASLALWLLRSAYVRRVRENGRIRIRMARADTCPARIPDCCCARERERDYLFDADPRPSVYAAHKMIAEVQARASNVALERERKQAEAKYWQTNGWKCAHCGTTYVGLVVCDCTVEQVRR